MMTKEQKDLASTELLLMQRAKEADHLIDELRTKIAELKRNIAPSNQQSCEALLHENAILRKEVEDWKNKLIQAQIGCGIRQSLPPVGKPTGISNGENAAPAFAKEIVSLANEDKVADPKPEEHNKKIETKGKKQQAKEGKPKGEAKKGKAEQDEGLVDVSRLNFKVGKILSAKRHADADSLYVEDVDVGEEKNRTVVSGLVKFVPVEEMQDRMVVLLCNLKPAKMRGVTSEAMVMCASSPEKVEILTPPAGSIPGDIVEVEGYPRKPDPVLNPKKKIFETVAPDLRVDGNKLATYKGLPLSVRGKGPVVSPSLINVAIK